MSRKYEITKGSSRGPERKREDDGTKVLSIKFLRPEYNMLKRISLETGVPMKELLRRAAIMRYGSPKPEDALESTKLRHYPQGATKKGSEEKFRKECSPFVFTAETSPFG